MGKKTTIFFEKIGFLIRAAAGRSLLLGARNRLAETPRPPQGMAGPQEDGLKRFLPHPPRTHFQTSWRRPLSIIQTV
jgi:hypothetical protein